MIIARMISTTSQAMFKTCDFACNLSVVVLFFDWGGLRPLEVRSLDRNATEALDYVG